MPEIVGLAILSATGIGDAVGIAGLGTIGTTTIFGTSIATVLGSSVIIGAAIGLQYALRPHMPTPESGAQPVQQAIPPRIRGYGTNRLAGYYMLFEAAAGNSYDVMAFHSGRIGSVVAFYLHDDVVQTALDISHGGGATVLGTYADGRYSSDRLRIEVHLGDASQIVSATLISDPNINGIWNSSHRGDGIAYAVLECAGVNDVPTFTKIYPHQLPVLSVVANCSVVCDPRDPAQSRDDESTWITSFNPVIQLIDYLTRSDGGVGLDFDIILPPDRLAQWMIEADLCDELVARADGSFEARYESNGWFQFDNNPEDVINSLLSTCDGWLAESGDGSLSLTVGVYRAPADPPLTEDHISNFAIAYGQTDEESVNQLDVTITAPANNYASVQVTSVRDDAAIALAGAVRSRALDLTWVQSYSQANRLALRAMARLNPVMTGSFTTTLYGLRYLGNRWVPVQYPFVSGLQNCVVEIQGAEVDLMAGQIHWTFVSIATDTIEAYDPGSDEDVPPPIPPSLLIPTMDFSKIANSSLLVLFEDI